MTVVIFLGSLMAAMALGIPIAFSLLMCGVALMLHMGMFDGQILAQNLLEGANSFPLLAVPFFMLAGEIMNAGGLSRRIVNFAMSLVGHIRGGLGYVTIVAAVIMASLSGSAVADAAALTALLLPMMVAAGHDKAQSAGLIAAGGIIAPIIPPSIGFVVFGVAGGVSISKLFMAGIFPGVWLALALVITWWWLVRKEELTPPPRKTTAEVFEALRLAAWALVLPLIIVFGLKFGIFTPTEAAVVAAVYALFVAGVVYRELSWKQLYEVFERAAMTTALVMFLVAAAMVSAWLIAVANLPAQLVAMLQSLTQDETGTWFRTPYNNGQAQVLGLELEAKGRLRELWPDAPQMELRAANAFNRSRVANIPGPNNVLAQQPRQSTTIGLDHRLGHGWSWGASWVRESVDWVRSTPQFLQKTSGKRQWDLYALQDLGQGRSWRLSVLNVLRPDLLGQSQYDGPGLSQSQQDRFRQGRTLRLALDWPI